GTQYTYASDIWCDSEGVAVLPYRLKHNYLDVKTPEFLGKYEVCPSDSEELELRAITGGRSKGESHAFVARKKWIEEGGYEVPVEKFTYLGEVLPLKSSDKRMHLFTVDIDSFNQKEVDIKEDGSHTEFISVEKLSSAKDSLLHAMFI